MEVTFTAQPSDAEPPTPANSPSSAGSQGPSAPPAAALSRSRRWIGPLLMVLSLAVLFGPGLAMHMANAADPRHFNDDARQQIWPFLRFFNRDLFREDATANYYLDCFPAGYKALYILATQAADPRAFSKVLPYLLLAVLVGAAAVAGLRLQGRWAAWGAAAFCLGAPVFLGRMTGGLPRSFAFPLYACAAAALICGRPIVLAVVVLLGVAFYPTVAVTAGLALAAMLLLLPASHRGAAARWSLRWRVTIVAITAGLTGLLALPTQRASHHWGAILRPADAGEYPELGPGGRYNNEEDRVPQLFSWPDLHGYVRWFLAGLGGPSESTGGLFFNPTKGIAISILAVLGLLGFTLLTRGNVEARRLMVLPAAAVLAHIVSIPVAPYLYLPARYQIYPLVILAVLLVPAGIAALPLQISRPRNSQRASALAVAIACGVYLVCYSVPKPSFRHGLHLDPGPIPPAGWKQEASDHPRTYAFIASLPPTAVIAGWPSDMDDLPYVTERSVYISREGHQVFHQRYANLMRERMHGLIDAYFSKDEQSLVRLRDSHVTHLLIDRRVYDAEPLKELKYFRPFDDEIEKARATLGADAPAALRLAEGAAVIEEGDWVMLDLLQLSPAPRKVVPLVTVPALQPAAAR